MAWPSDSSRTKNWGTEILTDTDLEGAYDEIHTYINDMMNASTGHKHDGTAAEGPKILVSNLDLTSGAQGDVIYHNGTSLVRLAAGSAGDMLQSQGSAANPTFESHIELNQISAPSTAVSQGSIYTKDTSGQPELFYREESDGDEVQLTSGGKVSGTGFGAYTSRAQATIYQAATDGIVIGIITYNSGTNFSIDLVGKTDSSATPTTVRARANVSAPSSGNDIVYSGSVTFPVLKDDYYQIDESVRAGSGSTTTTGWWIPIG